MQNDFFSILSSSLNMIVLYFDLCNPFRKRHRHHTNIRALMRITHTVSIRMKSDYGWKCQPFERIAETSKTNTISICCHSSMKQFFFIIFVCRLKHCPHRWLASLSLSLALASGSQCVIKQLQEYIKIKKNGKKRSQQQTEKLFNAPNVSSWHIVNDSVSFFAHLTH